MPDMAPINALFAYIDHGVGIPAALAPKILADPSALYCAARRAGFLARQANARVKGSSTSPLTHHAKAYRRAEAIARRIAINLMEQESR